MDTKKKMRLIDADNLIDDIENELRNVSSSENRGQITVYGLRTENLRGLWMRSDRIIEIINRQKTKEEKE